jgi:hypothetical protein
VSAVLAIVEFFADDVMRGKLRGNAFSDEPLDPEVDLRRRVERRPIIVFVVNGPPRTAGGKDSIRTEIIGDRGSIVVKITDATSSVLTRLENMSTDRRCATRTDSCFR